MDRLTTENGQLYACGLGNCNDEEGTTCGDCHYQEEAFKRLTEYENLGITPKEAASAKKFVEEFVKRKM